MINLADFVCTEQTETLPLSLKLHTDERRLTTLMDQEERFIPNNYQTTKQVRNYEEERARILELIYEAIFPEPEPRKSDAFHLAVNLMDRYLGYYPPSTEGEFKTVASACTMISTKLRRSRKECLSYERLKPHFYNVLEEDLRVTEKKIARTLKWDLNAITTADFIEEIAERLEGILTDDLDKIICHTHTIANVCLLYRSFMSVPPSLLACACLCDAISHCAKNKYDECVASITQMAGVEQEILIQHQKNVSERFLKKLEQSSLEEEQYTPNDIESINEQEFGQGSRFVYDEPLTKDKC